MYFKGIHKGELSLAVTLLTVLKAALLRLYLHIPNVSLVIVIQLSDGRGFILNRGFFFLPVQSVRMCVCVCVYRNVNYALTNIKLLLGSKQS